MKGLKKNYNENTLSIATNKIIHSL